VIVPANDRELEVLLILSIIVEKARAEARRTPKREKLEQREHGKNVVAT
jgi:hypothetical protein